jgi:hypothetical protein
VLSSRNERRQHQTQDGEFPQQLWPFHVGYTGKALASDAPTETNLKLPCLIENKGRLSSFLTRADPDTPDNSEFLRNIVFDILSLLYQPDLTTPLFLILVFNWFICSLTKNRD